MMLMIMVSLIGVCQSYPLTKKIGEQSVVIMTTKQAEDINNKFLSFKDSIRYLNTNLDALINKHNKYILSVKDSFNVINKEKILLGGQANWYKSEYYQMQDDLYNEVKGMRINMTILVVLFAALSVVLTLTTQ